MSAHQAEHRIAVMARVLGVSRSGYYAWRSRPASLAGAGGRPVEGGHSSRPRNEPGSVRGAPDSLRVARAGLEGGPEADRPADAGTRDLRGHAAAAVPHHGEQRRSAAGAGSGGPEVRGPGAGRALGGGHHPCSDSDADAVSGGGAGRLQPPGGGLGDGDAHADPTGSGGPGDGDRAAPTAGG